MSSSDFDTRSSEQRSAQRSVPKTAEHGYRIRDIDGAARHLNATTLATGLVVDGDGHAYDVAHYDDDPIPYRLSSQPTWPRLVPGMVPAELDFADSWSDGPATRRGVWPVADVERGAPEVEVPALGWVS